MAAAQASQRTNKKARLRFVDADAAHRILAERRQLPVWLGKHVALFALLACWYPGFVLVVTSNFSAFLAVNVLAVLLKPFVLWLFQAKMLS